MKGQGLCRKTALRGEDQGKNTQKTEKKSLGKGVDKDPREEFILKGNRDLPSNKIRERSFDKKSEKDGVRLTRGLHRAAKELPRREKGC